MKKPNDCNYFLEDQVVDSLRRGHRDHCFSYLETRSVLKAIEEAGLTVVWENRVDNHGEYDYTVFFPARYRRYSTPKSKKWDRVTGAIYERNNIPFDIECRIIEENKVTIIKNAFENVPKRR